MKVPWASQRHSLMPKAFSSLNITTSRLLFKKPAAGGDQIKGDRGWWLRSWVRLVASNRKPLYKNWNPNETVVEGEDSALIVPNFDVTIFPDAPKNDNKFVLLVRLKLVEQIPYNFTEPSHCAVHRLEMMPKTRCLPDFFCFITVNEEMSLIL